MQSLRQLISRIRGWRLWRVLTRDRVEPTALPAYFVASRPILRDVSAHGVRVYSLCGCCGAQLSASATLCESCARSRSTPNG